jgi:hypothetical protein
MYTINSTDSGSKKFYVEQLNEMKQPKEEEEKERGCSQNITEFLLLQVCLIYTG